MMETNFSLLSQEEIDTLIEFLSEKSNFVESEVLSQDSIDKLVALFRNCNKASIGSYKGEQEMRALAQVLDSKSEWILIFEEEEQTGYMEIYATNGERKEKITPKGFSNNCFSTDQSSWGYSISPWVFLEIAKTYNVKFTKDTYHQVCERYALKNYGDANYDIDEFFTGSAKELLPQLI